MLIRMTCIVIVKKTNKEIYENAREMRKGYLKAKLETLLKGGHWSVWSFYKKLAFVKAKKACMIYEDENILKKEQTSKINDLNRWKNEEHDEIWCK